MFQTRWVMSYLRGPLTRDQIRLLQTGRRDTESGPAAALPQLRTCRGLEPFGGGPARRSARAAVPARGIPGHAARPSPQAGTGVSAGAALGCQRPGCPGRRSLRSAGREDALRLVYRPRLLAMARVGFVDRKREVDAEKRSSLLMEPDSLGAVIRWDDGATVDLDANRLDSGPSEGSVFAPVPEALSKSPELSAAEQGFQGLSLPGAAAGTVPSARPEAVRRGGGIRS